MLLGIRLLPIIKPRHTKKAPLAIAHVLGEASRRRIVPMYMTPKKNRKILDSKSLEILTPALNNDWSLNPS
jgi:hypothetical protein